MKLMVTHIYLLSDVLPIAILYGLNFEHIKDDYDFTKLHHRSMFCSPDIKEMIDKMIDDQQS